MLAQILDPGLSPTDVKILIGIILTAIVGLGTWVTVVIIKKGKGKDDD